MSLGSRIVDGTGTKKAARVTDDHALVVSQSPYPETLTSGGGSRQQVIPFRQYFTADGLPAGSNDLRVDGSVTPQDFYISASAVGDLYITIISLAVSDSGATPAKFGTLAALTNGVSIRYTSETFDDIYIHDGFKTNFEMVRLGLGNPAIGGANDAFKVSNVIGNADTYMTNIKLVEFVPPYGIKLDYESSQKMIVKVSDNLSGLDGFDAIAFGFVRLANV